MERVFSCFKHQQNTAERQRSFFMPQQNLFWTGVFLGLILSEAHTISIFGNL